MKIVKDIKEIKEKSGIYLILCTSNMKGYIGSSCNLHSRLNNHILTFINKTHKNKYLQRAWNKYGEKGFEFFIVEYCNRNDLQEREQFYINLYNTNYKFNGYNLSCVKRRNEGYRHTGNTRKKLSKASKEQWSDPVNRQKASEDKKEYFSDPLNRQKTSEATSIAMNTTEMKDKISIAMKKFNVENPERVAEIKEARLKTFTTKEYREKASKIAKELWATDEHRNKMITERKERFSKQENRDKMKEISNDMWNDPVKYKEVLEKRSNITQEQFEQLKELHKLGYSQVQLAKVLNCKREAVGRICRGDSKLYSLT